MPHELKQRVLDVIQSGFPIAADPYAALGEALGCAAADVRSALVALLAEGTVRRVGASFSSAKLGYTSTLCALAVEPERLDVVATIVNEHPGVTHNYARENRYNLWFTLISPSAQARAATLADICARTGCPDLLDLPATHLFKIRVDFGKQSAESCAQAERPQAAAPAFDASDARDVAIVRWAQGNIAAGADGALLQRPFSALETCGVPEAELIERIGELKANGTIRRFGAMVRHQRMGYAFNGMTVWDIAPEQVQACGAAFAKAPFVSHCYERPRASTWPYNLYAMVHAKDKDELAGHVSALKRAAAQAGVAAAAPLVLVSTREYKKVSMRYFEEQI